MGSLAPELWLWLGDTVYADDPRPAGKEQQRHFWGFYGEPDGSPRRTRPGVYAAFRFGPLGRVLQAIVLDTRYFRSALRTGEFARADWSEGRPGPGVPTEDPAATVLAAEQRAWLELVLREPADLRVVASSIQIIADDHRFEKWGNFPAERGRFLNFYTKSL